MVPVPKVSDDFPLPTRNKGLELTLNNSVLSLYSLILAVQSCPIVFRQLAAFLPCSFPVHISIFGKAGGFPRCIAG